MGASVVPVLSIPGLRTTPMTVIAGVGMWGFRQGSAWSARRGMASLFLDDGIVGVGHWMRGVAQQ